MSAKTLLQGIGLLVILAIALSACAAAPAPAPAAPPTAAPAAQPTAAPAASAKPLIAGVVFQSDTFMQTVQAGMQAAADKAGVEMIMGNTENKLDKEASTIDDYITRKVDAIVITPISADGSVAALKKAKDAGIAVICFNTCVNDQTIPSAFLVTKNEDLGMKTGDAAVKFITEKLGGKATIGILNCDQFEGCPPRKTGFQEQLKALPDVKIVADQAGWLADKAQPVAEAMLQANPDINVLWSANEGGTVGEANAVKTLGLNGKVFVFGTDMNNQMGQMLQAEDDILQGVTGQAPYQMGYDALNTALDVLAGKTVGAVTNTPTIFFGRGNDALIKQFMDTEGNAIFKVEVPPGAEMPPLPPPITCDPANPVLDPVTVMKGPETGQYGDKIYTMAAVYTNSKLDQEFLLTVSSGQPEALAKVVENLKVCYEALDTGVPDPSEGQSDTNPEEDLKLAIDFLNQNPYNILFEYQLTKGDLKPEDIVAVHFVVDPTMDNDRVDDYRAQCATRASVSVTAYSNSASGGLFRRGVRLDTTRVAPAGTTSNTIGDDTHGSGSTTYDAQAYGSPGTSYRLNGTWGEKSGSGISENICR